MKGKVLITGGAGFIGSHLADELLRNGYAVRALDCLSPQVHSKLENGRPDYLAPEVDLRRGDVRNRQDVEDALQDVDIVYHFAAAVGVGQSMYAIADYTSVNVQGTAVLLEALIDRHRKKPFRRLVVASSMSLYGEGLYRNGVGEVIAPSPRSVGQLEQGDWTVRGADGKELFPFPTPETKTPSIESIYALTKYDQEQMCLMVGKAYGIPAVALRFFNVYGTRQSLSNPYTGVMAIFASRLLNNSRPVIFEDGFQKRDFVSVRDIARACRLAGEKEGAVGRAINVGSGRSYAIRDIAKLMGEMLGKDHLQPETTGSYRIGDIRHCFSDITLARRLLGYEPEVTLNEGLQELVLWLSEQKAHDKVAQAGNELEERGLLLHSRSRHVSTEAPPGDGTPEPTGAGVAA